MENSTLTIWCNAEFSGAARALLEEATRQHRLLFAAQLSASNLASGAPDPALATADVAFGQPDPRGITESAGLRWTHLTTAGYARYDTEEMRGALGGRGVVLTNSSGVYAEPCAEHALAFMLAQARQLPQSAEEQRTTRGWPIQERRGKSRLLTGQAVVLLGFGAIGRRLAELLAPFGMAITALRRKTAQEGAVKIIAEDGIEAALASADHVVNLLPENPATRRLVNARLFAAMRPGAVFYNIGRGTTVDQEALSAALSSGPLAAAYLDVTDPEPLPPAHPLWSLPNCFITPHTAGGHDTEQMSLVRHFVGNLERFVNGTPLRDRVI
jgi:phosphoglycerate dehydrogenase-like enzyme